MLAREATVRIICLPCQQGQDPIFSEVWCTKKQTASHKLSPIAKIAENLCISIPILIWYECLQNSKKYFVFQITYMGHTLLNYCSKTPELKQVIKELRIEHQERSVKERSIWEDPKEAYLTEILSNCRIRLLCRDDLVPCHDLPYNFWANDFADVKVPSDIWECVDKWNWNGEITSNEKHRSHANRKIGVLAWVPSEDWLPCSSEHSLFIHNSGGVLCYIIQMSICPCFISAL